MNFLLLFSEGVFGIMHSNFADASKDNKELFDNSKAFDLSDDKEHSDNESPILEERSDERASDYINGKNGKNGTEESEKMRFHETQKKDSGIERKDMKTLRKFPSFDLKSKPTSFGRFELDEGNVELGFDDDESEKKSSNGSKEKSNDIDDEKKSNKEDKDREQRSNGKKNDDRDVFIAFQSKEDDPRGEEKNKYRRFYKGLNTGIGTKVINNDQNFKRVDMLQTDDKDSKRLHRGLDKFSVASDRRSVFDDVISFNNNSSYQQNIDFLRDSARQNANGRTEVQKSITAQQNLKSKNDAMKLNFESQLDRQIERMELNYKKSDDFWLILKKKSEQNQILEDILDVDSVKDIDDETVKSSFQKDKTIPDVEDELKKESSESFDEQSKGNDEKEHLDEKAENKSQTSGKRKRTATMFDGNGNR